MNWVILFSLYPTRSVFGELSVLTLRRWRNYYGVHDKQILCRAQTTTIPHNLAESRINLRD